MSALLKMAKVLFEGPSSLESVKPGIDSFGILINNKSLEKLPKVSNKFDDCFIVNNFDKEIDIIGSYFIGKNIIQFSNQSLWSTPLNASNYIKLGIKEIQLRKSSSVWDYKLSYLIYIYQKLGLRTVFLPKHLNVSGLIFGPSFKEKFPSTDLLAIYYTLEIIRPKNLWIVGLDFYEHGYFTRKVDDALIKMKREKLKRANAYDVVNNWIKYYNDININIVTYYEGFGHNNNLNLY